MIDFKNQGRERLGRDPFSSIFIYIIIYLIYIMSWTDAHDESLYIIFKYSNTLYKQYHKNYIKSKQRLQKYRIPIIILSSISGFLSISNSGYIPDEYNKWVSLIVGFFNLLTSLVSLIENFKKIDQTVIKSQETYISFKKINDNISLLLRTPREERKESGTDSVEKFFQLFENTLLNAPILKGNSVDLFEFEKIKLYRKGIELPVTPSNSSISDNGIELQEKKT